MYTDTMNADLINDSAYGEWECGECGVRFDSTYKSWPACPNCLTHYPELAKNAVQAAYKTESMVTRLADMLGRAARAMGDYTVSDELLNEIASLLKETKNDVPAL